MRLAEHLAGTRPMNLSLYGRALANSKLIVLIGIVLAVVLALLSVAKVSWKSGPTVSYRKPEVWQNGVTLLVTQRGFPEGRVVFPAGGSIPFSDPNRLSYLADLYAQMATSDPVTKLLKKQGPVTGKVQAAVPFQNAITGASEPLIQLTATGSTPEAATRLTQRAMNAFLSFLDGQQRAAHIPIDQRSTVTMIRGVDTPVLIGPRKMTLPIIVFIAVLAATFVLALMRENRRRARAEEEEAQGAAQDALDTLENTLVKPAVASEGLGAGLEAPQSRLRASSSGWS